VSFPLQPSDRAPGLLVGEGAEIPVDVEIGGHVVVHAGTRIGSGCVLQDQAVVGKPSRLGSRSSAPREPADPAVLGDGAAVLAGAVVFAGAEIGPGAIVGDQAQVRERATVGAEALIGRGSAVDNDVAVGARVSVQSNCYVTAYSVVEDDVFIGPGVTLTNDNTMSRHAPGSSPQGPTLRRACRIGGGAVICPGLEIGEEAFVGAGAVVTADVPARAVMVGVPARAIREVPDDDLLERWR
jgi:acetyltransferase-like isoleucine patch superfamily enzyme